MLWTVLFMDAWFVHGRFRNRLRVRNRGSWSLRLWKVMFQLPQGVVVGGRRGAGETLHSCPGAEGGGWNLTLMSKLQALVYDIFGGRCRKGMLGVWLTSCPQHQTETYLKLEAVSSAHNSNISGQQSELSLQPRRNGHAGSVQFSSVQFSSVARWYPWARKSPYALLPISRKFPQRCLWNSPLIVHAGGDGGGGVSWFSLTQFSIETLNDK